MHFLKIRLNVRLYVCKRFAYIMTPTENNFKLRNVLEDGSMSLRERMHIYPSLE